MATLLSPKKVSLTIPIFIILTPDALNSREVVYNGHIKNYKCATYSFNAINYSKPNSTVTKAAISKNTFSVIPACLSRMLSGFKKDAGQAGMTNIKALCILTYSRIIKINLKIKDKNIFTEIVDNGPGINSEDMNRLFEAFYRSKRTSEKGTGLGLTISKKIIEAHGGTIGHFQTRARYLNS